MINRKILFSLLAFTIVFLFYFLFANSKVYAQSCCDVSQCPPPAPCWRSNNWCNGSAVVNYEYCYYMSCDGASCPDYTGYCSEHISSVTLDHSDPCGCGCSGDTCASCKTCTVVNRTYNQCCSPGYSQWVQEMAWSDGSGVCGYNSGACNQSDPACGSSAYCGDGSCNNGETCSTCSGDCSSCPPGQYCGDNSCNNGETCSTCPNDCGSCGSNPYCGDSACNNGETCSTCPGDCGSCTGVSCNSISLSAAPNPAPYNSNMTFTISGDGSTYQYNTFTGGVSSCGGEWLPTWDSKTCTTYQSGTFQWSHTWKHCVDTFDNCSPTCSATMQFTVNVPIPAVPGGLGASCSAPGTTGSLSWNSVAGATYYNVRYDSSYTKNNITGTSTTITGFTPGSSHSWAVQACNSSGCSGWSSNNNFTCVPAAPTNLSASCPAPGTTGSLSWSASSGATSYSVGIDNLKNGWVSCASLNSGDFCGSPATNSYSFSSEIGATYAWWVKACNAGGCSAQTNASSNFTCIYGTISANPNPCYVASGANTCSSTVTWNTNSPTATVCVADGGGGNIFLASGTTGTQYADISPAFTRTFRLFDANNSCSGINMAQVTVSAITSPWIQTTGDVHSNEEINAPGGP